MVCSVKSNLKCNCCGEKSSSVLTITYDIDNLDIDVKLCIKCVGELSKLINASAVSLIERIA